MIRRAVFVAGVAQEGEKQLWERDLEFWANGLGDFDQFDACVLDGNLSSSPDGVGVYNAKHATISATINRCAHELKPEDELWIVISNHGDCVPTGASGFSTATPKTLFSQRDLNKAIGTCSAKQVVIAGQCGAGHFCAKPPSNRVVLAACGYMQFGGRIETHSTHNEWLLLVGLALFPNVALDRLSKDEQKWRMAASRLSSNISLEAAFTFAAYHTQALNPRSYKEQPNTTQTQVPRLANPTLARDIFL